MADLILARRLAAMRITPPLHRTPAAAVARLGAIQAQDYLGALWAVGLRVEGATEASVEAAIASRAIVRTWPMRGTLHFLAAADARWMLALLAPRVVGRNEKMMKRHFDIDAKVVTKASKVAERVLRDGPVTREALYEHFDDAGLDTASGRGLHLVWHLAHHGQICFGPRQGKQQTFVLMDDWLAPTPSFERDEALGELARRYFAGHGPARLQDFAWWSGLTLADTKRAVEIAGKSLDAETFGEKEYFSTPGAPEPAANAGIHLLPAFDEYLVGYKDRGAAVAAEHLRLVCGVNGFFPPLIVVDGRVIGTWKRTLTRGQAVVTLEPFGKLSKPARARILPAVRRYGVFLGVPGVLPGR